MSESSSVGIVGAGQLARMMAQAAIPLAVRVVVLAARPDDGAARVIPDVIVGSPDDPAKIRELASRVDVVTFDHELVDPDLLAELEREGVTVYPSSSTMALAQNKRRQRAELSELGLPVPPFAFVDNASDVRAFGSEHGWPIVLKATTGGYDGRGVWVVGDQAEGSRVVDEAHAAGLTLLAEQHLKLDYELAVLVARRPDGEFTAWEPVETVQRDGMCNELAVPVMGDARLLAEAVSHARKIAEHVNAVGVLAIEFFVADGKLYVNELAPRPHNSGHWTIEGAATSQFEQHLRAVLDLPLGDTALRAPCIATHNVIGPEDNSDPADRLSAALAVNGVHVHLYGKAPRAGRKLGHVTVLGSRPDDVNARAAWAVARLRGEDHER